MVEGHTDAVGADVDNLSLSDRRAESVAVALTEQFQVPAENLVTQGYGEQYLKVPTDGPEQANRRVARAAHHAADRSAGAEHAPPASADADCHAEPRHFRARRGTTAWICTPASVDTPAIGLH